MSTEANKRMEDILNSLNGVRKATAPDFFYTRLKARMERGLTGNENKKWILRPALAFAALALVLLMNAFVLVQKNETSIDTAADNNDIAQSVASDYSLTDNNIYDLNQD